jgi:hypothetical protein
LHEKEKAGPSAEAPAGMRQSKPARRVFRIRSIVMANRDIQILTADTRFSNQGARRHGNDRYSACKTDLYLTNRTDVGPPNFSPERAALRLKG